MGHGTQRDGLSAVTINPDGKPDRRRIRARQRAIGREISHFYDGVVEEGIPPEMRDLVRQIDSVADETSPRETGS